MDFIFDTIINKKMQETIKREIKNMKNLPILLQSWGKIINFAPINKFKPQRNYESTRNRLLNRCDDSSICPSATNQTKLLISPMLYEGCSVIGMSLF